MSALGGGLRWVAGMFDVGSLGPRWMPQGSPGGRPRLAEQPAWGALGQAERAPGSRRGLRARPLCVLGNARELQLQRVAKVAGLHASRHPGGRTGTSAPGRGRTEREPQAGFPWYPQALPRVSGALSRSLVGPQAPSSGSATTASPSPRGCNC